MPESFLYTLAFLPIIIITLIIHEAGHFISAKLFNLHIAGFQIGIGTKVFETFTGRTDLYIPQSAYNISPKEPAHSESSPVNALRTSQVVTFWIARQEPQSETFQVTAFQTDRIKNPTKDQTDNMISLNNTHFKIRGKIRGIDSDTAKVSPTSWRLGLIPIAAAVHLPTDPREEIPHTFNTISWKKKTIVITAGSFTNLLVVAFAILAMSFITIQPTILSITAVRYGSPAHAAGLQYQDQIFKINNHLLPNTEKLKEYASQDKTFTMEIFRKEETLTLQVTPSEGYIGVFVEIIQRTNPSRSNKPSELSHRFINLTQIYLSIFSKETFTEGEEGDQKVAVTGPLVAATQTAEAIKFAGFYGILAVIAAVNLSMGIMNLLPIPPLDGYNNVKYTIIALRKGKPISEKPERLMIFIGVTLLAALAIFVTILDIAFLIE